MLRLEPLEPRQLLSYAVTDLGAYCNPAGLNEAGLVVMLCGLSGDQTPTAWRDGESWPLGVPDGAKGAVANGVNDAGLIVGSAGFPDGHYEAAFLGGSPIALGTFGGLGSGITAVNNAGQVAGFYDAPDGLHAYLGGNAVTDLGRDFFLYALSDDGKLAGTARLLPAWWHDGQFDPLPVPQGGYHGEATGISHDGRFMAGGVSVERGGTNFTHALRWENGALADLPVPPGQNGSAAAVNDAGLVVGAVGSFPREAAWIWDGAGGHDLNSLIPADSGWRLSVTAGINDAGQVIGRGTGPDGLPHGYLLTPDAGPAAPPAWLGWALGLAQRKL